MSIEITTYGFFAEPFSWPFAFPWLDAVVPDDAVFECFVWPGAFAELPRVGCAPCCASCFCWPGVFPELPWPFPATALPLNAITATATARTPPRPLLGRCITSPRLWDCLGGASCFNEACAREDTALNAAKLGVEPLAHRLDEAG